MNEIETIKRLATEFKHDDEMEKLVEMSRLMPQGFAQLPVEKRMAAGHYLLRKDAKQSGASAKL